MDLTFQSLINTLLFSSVAIILLSYMISGYHMMSKIGFAFLTFISSFVMFRLFIPFEFRFMQSNVYLTKVYPDIYMAMKHSSFSVNGLEFTPLNIIAFIILTGSIIYFVRLIFSYVTIRRKLSHYSKVEDSTILNCYNLINQKHKHATSFYLVTDTEITMPCVFGLVKPIIALPNIPLSEAEWYSILSHEMAHFYHKDLWVRFGCELLKVLYWWNPFIYLFQKQIIRFQESRIDTDVMRNLDELQQLEYLDCLVKMAKMQAIQQNKWIASFNDNHEITNRIKGMLRFTEKTKATKLQNIKNLFVSLLLVIFVLFLPNFIILEPRADVPDNIVETTNDIDNANTYLILQENGTYDVYTNDKYIGSATSIFDKNMKVINWKGEIIHEKKEPRHLNNLFEHTF